MPTPIDLKARNAPCPCGSGEKYKRCCLARGLGLVEVADAAHRGLPMLRAREAAEADRRARFGEGRPPITAEWKGFKFVAVGSALHYEKEWNTFPDFLMDYVVQVLGEPWFNAELARPAGERHPVMEWRWSHYETTKGLPKGPDGLIAAPMTGHQAALLTLGNDLYVLKHNSAFRDDIVDRLRHRDQFAGARYELYAAATCVRAGMSVRHENERDRSRRHVEFIATHAELGVEVAVEAKQRHRPANHPAVPGTARPDVVTLVNKALKKRPGMPFVIFTDLDMDPPPASDSGWVGRIEAGIRTEMAKVETNANGPLAANAILLTNTAYARSAASVTPLPMIYVHTPAQALHPLDEAVPFALFQAAMKHRNIPTERLGASARP